MRALLLALILLSLTACAPAVRLRDRPAEPIWFIHPKSHASVGGLTGVDIPIQVWFERHPDNRQITLDWRGPGCSGSSSKSLDGQYEASVYPAMRYLLARMRPGVCTIIAALFGPDGEIRHRAVFEMTVMGGEAGGR